MNEIVEVMALAVTDRRIVKTDDTRTDEGVPVIQTVGWVAATAALTALKEAGYVVVPREPGRKALNRAVKHIGGGSTFDMGERFDIANSIYRAMISAAEAE